MRRHGATSVVAVVGVLAVWALRWEGPDWPAQLYRVALFRSYGWLLWDTRWYGGHYLLPYSVLFPALGAALGLYGAALASATLAAWAFDRLLRTSLPTGTGAASILFAVGTLVPVVIGQLPFLAGEAVGLLALVMARAHRRAFAALLACCTSLLSPVAGVLLALAFVAWTISASADNRRTLLALGALTATPLLVIGAIFPEAGSFPFWGSDFLVLLGLGAVGWAFLPKQHRVLRCGLAVYTIVAAGLFAVPNPLGGNYVRLAAAVAPSLLIAASFTSGRRLLMLLAAPLVVWQWSPAFAAWPKTAGDASRSEYFRPILHELADQTSTRIEIPFTEGHWEVAYVAPTVPLARGWERQTDIATNPIFYGRRPVTASTYRRWLADAGVQWVALPDVPLDYSARAEGKLLANPPSYLKLAWHNRHWRLWSVQGTPGMITGPATLVSSKPDGFVIDAASAGTVIVRVRYTKTWSVTEGRACLSLAPHGWTRLTTSTSGPVEVHASLVDHDGSCHPTKLARP
jgi:hypothetical protein